MSRIVRVADRLVERLVPRVTADAACILLHTTPWACTGMWCNPVGSGWVQQRTSTYDNCPPKTETRCVASC